MITQDYETVLDQMEELALARAEQANNRWYASEYCSVGNFTRVRCVVHRRSIRGVYQFRPLFEADDWRMAKCELLRQLGVS